MSLFPIKKIEDYVLTYQPFELYGVILVNHNFRILTPSRSRLYLLYKHKEMIVNSRPLSLRHFIK